MKKSLIAFISILLMLTVVFSSFALVSASAEKPAQTYNWSEETPFIRYEDEQGIRYLGPVGNAEQAYVQNEAVVKEDKAEALPETHQNKSELAAVGDSAPLPESVDLGASKYFPPIGNQGGLGSCATFSTTYYQLSYEMNRQRDVAATAENTLSPQLVYNLMSSSNTNGTVADFNYNFLNFHGAPTMELLPYSDADSKSWHAEEEIWRNAFNSRVDEFFVIEDVGGEDTQITSPDDEDLKELKTVLANGNPIVYGTCIYSWVGAKIEEHPDAPENSKFAGEEIIKYQDGGDGGHSMILVGYNDNIWVDQNSNGKVDSGELGAFKIANSWGDGYANGGFCWVAYDALNKVSAVEGGFSGARRETALTSFRWITVKPYGENSGMYVRFILSTKDRVQMNVRFSSEHNGIEEEGRFLMASAYRNEGNRFGFDGTPEETDGTFCFALDNVSPELCAENFDSYSFFATFEDTTPDGKALQVKSVEIVNEYTGKVYKMSEAPFSVDGETKTILIKNAETTDKAVYYIGFDEPTINYRIGDGEFTSAKMTYTEANIGYNYMYVIEDAPEDLTLYFTDDKGNKDDNGGKLFKASERLSFFRTGNVREAVTVTGFEYPNGEPDVGKICCFEPEISGGYEPYSYGFSIENLATGEIAEFPYDYRYEKCYTFNTEGSYKLTMTVRDQAGDVDIYEEILQIQDRAFIFAELTAASKYGEGLFVGENVSIYARTEFEKIISRGNQHSLYEFVIKDSEGKVCHKETLRSYEFHMGYCVSHVYLDWTPKKTGEYSVTVSSTDAGNEYAEKTIAFTIFDKVFGDADADGKVTVKDATAIQKYIADIFGDAAFMSEVADVDSSSTISIKDATCIRKYIANISGSKETGKILEYIPDKTEPETSETEAPTESQTQPVKPVTATVVFTNSLSWSGVNMYCYYWSSTNTNMTTWPGEKMANIGPNDFNEVCYSFEVPADAEYVIFTNGTLQTVDIPFNGEEAKFYPLNETDSKGGYKVANW